MVRWRCLSAVSAAVIGSPRVGCGPTVRGDRPRSVSPASAVLHGSPRRYRRTVLQVRLLGGPAVTRDGVPVALPAALGRVTAYLALHPGPHDRLGLAARFWPDCPAETARSNLRTAVWAMRKALGPDAVIGSRSAAGLDPAAVWVDVAEVAARVA